MDRVSFLLELHRYTVALRPPFASRGASVLLLAPAMDDSKSVSRGAALRGGMGILKLLDIDAAYRGTVWWHTLAWLLLGVFLGGAMQQIGFVVKKIGGSPALVSMVMTGPQATSLLAVVYAPLLERFEVRSLVALPRLIGAGIFIAIGAFSGPIWLAVCALIATTVLKVGDTFYGRLLGQMYPLQGRGRMQSLPMFVNAAGAAAVSVLAGWILKTGEGAYRLLLPAVGVVGMFSALAVLRIPLHTKIDTPPRTRLRQSLREVARDKPFLMWVLVYSLTSVGFWFTYSALPVFFESVLKFGYLENGIALAVFNAVYCIGFLVCGRILDRFRSLMTMVIGWSLTALGTLIIAVGGSLEWVLVGQALSGLGLAGNDIAWFTVVLEFAPAQSIDRYMGFYMAMFGLRALIGGTISGILMELSSAGSWIALIIASAVMFVGAATMLTFRHKSSSRSAGS